MMESTNWNYPTNIWAGEGRHKEITQACGRFGMSRLLVVVDSGLLNQSWVNGMLEQLSSAYACTIKSDVPGNPAGDDVAAGCALAGALCADGVVAVGGGSVIDAAKAMALMTNQTVSLWELEDIGDQWQRADPDKILPVIAIPTTAGTGSEVGRVSVITNPDEQRKVLIFHPDMPVNLVILDPVCIAGLPPSITAATGMDALSHCLEAWCAPGFHPMADGIALSGMKLIKQSLATSVFDGGNLVARTHMLTASVMGATAFQKGLGAMHALAHPLGARYGLHHGLLNAVLMPYVVERNAPAIQDRLVELARSLELGERPANVVDWILELRDQLSIPTHLQAPAGDSIDSVWVSEQAVRDPSAATNPIPFTAQDYESLLQSALG